VIDLATIAANLERTPDGLWRAKLSSPISYPDWGNQACFQVEEKSFWFRHRNACILEAMRQFPPGGAVFDIGGGNGFVAKAIQDTGLEVALVEPGPAGAHNALRRGVKAVVCTTLEDAGFVPESMPAIGLFDVVEHMHDDREFLQRVRGQLAPGGRLYVTVPAYQALWSQEDVDAGHHRRYSRESLRSTLLTSGFVVEYLTGFFQFLLPAIFAVRVVPYRIGLAKSPAPEEVTQQMAKQHIPRSSSLSAMLRLFEQRELAALQARVPLRLGASWLLVASKA
jgi:SAM-dependent methyltransferase